MDNITKLAIDLTLGDGWLGKKQNHHKTQMRIEHTIKQKEYARSKEDLLIAAGLMTTAKQYISTTTKNAGKAYYRIDVFATKDLDAAYSLLYIAGKKSIKNVIQFLDERSLAYLFLDDGSAALTKYALKKYAKVFYEIPYIGGFKLSIQNYSLEDANLLSEWIRSLGIDNKVNTPATYHGAPIITIHSVESKRRLVDIVKPYITTDMLYKVQHPLTASETSIAYKIPR